MATGCVDVGWIHKSVTGDIQHKRCLTVVGRLQLRSREHKQRTIAPVGSLQRKRLTVCGTEGGHTASMVPDLCTYARQCVVSV